MKIKLIACMLFVSILSYGQEEDNAFKIAKNTWTLGGLFNYNSNTDNEPFRNSEVKNKRFIISPNVGYAIRDNLVVGASIDYLYAKTERGFVPDFILPNNESNFIGFTTYITKYYNITKNLLFNLQGGLSYSIGKTEGIESDFKFDSTLLRFSIVPEITYGINKKLAFKLNLGGLGYSKFKIDSNEGTQFDFKQEQESFNFNLQTSNLSIGVICLLN